MQKLKASERPHVWFFKTVNESNKKGIPRARLIEGQLIPTEAEGVYIPGNVKLNVEADHELRKSNAIGAIFYTQKIGLIEIANRDGYYITQKTGVDLVTNNPEVNAVYKEFIATGKTPRLKSVPKFDDEQEEDLEYSKDQDTVVANLMVKYAQPTTKTDNFYVTQKNWSLLLTLYNRRRNILLSGPSGVAKSKLAKLLAQRLGVPFFKIDFASKLDPISSLIGTHRHDPAIGSYFDRSPFIDAIQKPGIILLDEINRATSEANNILFPLLDESRELTIDQEMGIKERVVKMHPDCIFLATCNQGPEFVGTKSLDPAFKARFGNIPIDYLPAVEERKLLFQLTKADKKSISTVVEIANEIRALYLAGEITEGIGVRETISASELLADGIPLETALEFAFVNPFSKEEQSEIRDILSGH